MQALGINIEYRGPERICNGLGGSYLFPTEMTGNLN